MQTHHNEHMMNEFPAYHRNDRFVVLIDIVDYKLISRNTKSGS